ncbi:unnamed protein product [Colias eurytheme]|nr:unnamed protein product [Colias eurytheme]
MYLRLIQYVTVGTVTSPAAAAGAGAAAARGARPASGNRRRGRSVAPQTRRRPPRAARSATRNKLRNYIATRRRQIS